MPAAIVQNCAAPSLLCKPAVVTDHRKLAMPTAVAVGRDAEARAQQFLQQQGLKFIEKNFRCRGGEIDLVMRDQEMLVFVEVRFRKNQRFGGAAASVGPVKQQRLWRSASIYLMRFARPPACRFDLVAIEGEDLQWIKNLCLSPR